MSVEIIYKYFPNLSQKQIAQIEKLKDVYTEWNSKINVISRKDIDSIYIHHILHSLAIAKFIQFEKGTKIIDVGTGGGFPGVPLAILFPDCEFTLCDSIAKKLKVVDAVCSELNINNVTTLWGRVESSKENYDYVVSRAVTELKNFMPWVKDRYKKGIIYLKGGDLEQELKDAITECKLNENKLKGVNISDFYDEDFFETKKIIFIQR